MFRLIAGLATLAFANHAFTADPPSARQLVEKHSHTFEYDTSTLRGQRAGFLLTNTTRNQFVLLGEDHMDHATPIFSGALYRLLHDRHGFRYVVVEQDPLAIEAALASPLRGNADNIAALATRYPTLFEFDTDEDLQLLARVGQLENRNDAIWGVEQATGAVTYLEELVTRASSPAAKRLAQQLLAEARAADPGPRYSVNWLAASGTETKLKDLRERFGHNANPRARSLLRALEKSAEIFGYYRRAEAGEFVGLYNNTVREAELKRNFLERYRRAAKRQTTPKAMFKFGSNHLYHGKNPTQAFPIGNLAHELAITNDLEAYGIYVLALGPDYKSYQDYPAWLLPLLPANPPTVPTVIDLRALRPYQRIFREHIAPDTIWEQRALLHGYEAIVVLPHSRPGERKLGGREQIAVR